ncbi:MAG TPA: S8 family serine peptidase [Tepidisphaeraceae bacterium]|nr:S8 family serine peptidase [Tepidisphaeraceae bacterium]
MKTVLAALNFRRASIAGHLVSGWMPLGRLNELASISGLRFARPALFTTHVGNTTTQGDAAMRADVARSTYNFTGAGVKVGILSDSFDTGSGSYATDISTGDLPAGVQILQDSPGGTDEGRGMAQIVHDVAPGASIAFATANGGQSGFANNIRALANAGAKVIVDDVQYFAEPMFQDGPISQAIDDVVAAGAVYFSAAGNEGHDAWSDDYTPATTYNKNAFGSNPGAPRFGGGTSHDFDPGPGVDDKQTFSLDAGQRLTITLQWDQPFFSISGGGGSRADMDVFVLDAASNRIVAGGTDNNVGGDAVEVVQFINPFGSSHEYNLLIVRAGGVSPTLLKYVFFGPAAFGEFAQPQAGTIYGHSNAAGAVAVAAAPFYQTPAFGFDPPIVEYYSSAGPSPILFSEAGGVITPITRQQPKVTAPDGGNTTFFGQDSGQDADSFPNFFGTSAAAPHAAAVAALLLQANSNLSPAQVAAAMENTALDMDEPATGGFDAGLDFRTGYGLIQADAAIRSVLPAGSISGRFFIDRNGDGVFDAGENGLEAQSAFLDSNNNWSVDLATATRASNAAQAFSATGLISAPLKILGLAGLIDGVNLSLNLTHPNISELHATLISPAGSRIAVILPPDGNLLDQPIGGIRGENPNGVWRLEIVDDNAGAQGSLTSWSMTLVTGDITATSDSAGQYSFPHLEPGIYSLRAPLPGDFIRTTPASGIDSVSLSSGASLSSRNFGFFPTRFVGSSGDDLFTIDLDPSHSRLQIGDYSIDKSLITSLAFDGGDGNDQLNVDIDANDTLHIAFDAGFDSLVINGGQIGLDDIANLSIDVASADAMLVVSTTAANRDALMDQINLLLHSGRNGGLWNGVGISSSGAAADSQHLTGLAAVGSWQLDPFAANNDVFIKLVRNGDSDLDNDIDSDDYDRLDAAWADPPAESSYFFGDFNYSGRIDSDDFFLIDRAFSA